MNSNRQVDLLAIERCLDGDWIIRRKIPGQARLLGKAQFRAQVESNLIDYIEFGVLQMADGNSFEARREYVFEKQAGGLKIYFKEEPQRLFQMFEFVSTTRGLQGWSEHICGSDVYRSSFRITRDGRMSFMHKVKGLRKDYKMVTLYRRAA